MKRVQRKRLKGWKMPENTVYIGRGSKWGNPFRVVEYEFGKWAVKTDGSFGCNQILIKNCRAFYSDKSDAVNDAVQCYRDLLLPYSHKEGDLKDFYISKANLDDLAELEGKDLACWCPEGEPCHGDVLIEMINFKKR